MKVDSSEFNSKIVIVVGGSKGIGEGLVNKFKNLGANVFPISRHNCDITDKTQIDKYIKTFDKIDILINSAAINYCKSIDEIEYEEWDKVIKTNLTSYFYLIKSSLPLMKRGSKIVNISSIAGRHKSVVAGIHYTSSKAGIIGLTRQLANELGPIGININCVCPSQTLTPMLMESMTRNQINELEKSIPLRRIATIEDIVNPIIFLCSKNSAYIHGACIDINGGQF